ncbi:hypothetical protein AAFG13_06090 [Bradyrhizobium sp. B124]|uniref:hypothetical protein n=1 Tax=Bradyrhizobium sp. B124 TaxID=3140245 RepID=UPI0031839DCF
MNIAAWREGTLYMKYRSSLAIDADLAALRLEYEQNCQRLDRIDVIEKRLLADNSLTLGIDSSEEREARQTVSGLLAKRGKAGASLFQLFDHAARSMALRKKFDAEAASLAAEKRRSRRYTDAWSDMPPIPWRN